MNLPCSVIRDLLPLYAEHLTSEESNNLVRDHMEGCDACREYFEHIQLPSAPVSEDAAPMRLLKKELRKRRWRTAAIVSLSVFLALFALLAYMTDARPLPYRQGLLNVEGLTSYDPTAEQEAFGGVNRFQPEGWQTAYPEQALVITRSQRVSGISSEYDVDDETGEVTVYLQYFTNKASGLSEKAAGQGFVHASLDGNSVQDCFYPVPDRIIYGLEGEQTLLWGEPMSGGVQFLPRLVLAYYALLAAGAAVILAILGFAFRRKPFHAVLLQILFAPLSYLLAQLVIKGTRTMSMFLTRDLAMIGVEALAFYLLFTLSHQAWRQHKRDQLES